MSSWVMGSDPPQAQWPKIRKWALRPRGAIAYGPTLPLPYRCEVQFTHLQSDYLPDSSLLPSTIWIYSIFFHSLNFLIAAFCLCHIAAKSTSLTSSPITYLILQCYLLQSQFIRLVLIHQLPKSLLGVSHSPTSLLVTRFSSIFVLNLNPPKLYPLLHVLTSLFKSVYLSIPSLPQPYTYSKLLSPCCVRWTMYANYKVWACLCYFQTRDLRNGIQVKK